MQNPGAVPVRVAITGVGLVTPLGVSTAANLDHCLSGQSAIGPIHSFEVDGHGCRAGAYVPEFDLSNVLRFPKNDKFMSHSVRCAMQAGREAVQSSGIDLAGLDPVRVALYAGSGQTSIEYDEYFQALTAAWENGREMDFKHLGGLPSRLIDRYIVLRTLANGGVGLLSTELGIKGPNGNFVQSDTASAQALNCAYYDLVEHRCDAALAGGHDSLLIPSNFLAYEKAGLLSGADPAEAYRPFDLHRDGLALGAGACFLMLERWEDAEARGARILGDLCGVGLTGEAADSGEPGWDAGALGKAIAESVGDERIDFVVGRGIGTVEGDAGEAQAIDSLVGTGVPVTALKSRTGYLGAATAAVELGLGLLCARRGSIPAIARHTACDPECRLDLVWGETRPAGKQPVGLFLSRSWCGQMAAIAARALEA